MDRLMDRMLCPAAATELRSFRDKPTTKAALTAAYQDWIHGERKLIEQYWAPGSFLRAKNRRDVFFIRILYRQHSSWQDQLVWRGERIKYFRSALELRHLIESALQ